MLDSYQIAAALFARGLSRTPAKADRTKAHGFQSATLVHPLFVRMGGHEGALRSVADDPLALHPDDADRLRSRQSELTGLKLRDHSNPSSAYVGYPPRIVNGRTSSYEGIRCSIENEQALDQLLATLGHFAQEEVDGHTAGIDQVLHAAAEADIAQDPKSQNLGPTTRKALVDARLGQGGFRRRMRALWGDQCAVTGCQLTKALIASHALAWKHSEPHEKLDEYNGLLLTASIDRLFDQGLISFAESGQMLCKPDLSAGDLACLGLHPGAHLRFVHKNHQPYLAAHRKRFRF